MDNNITITDNMTSIQKIINDKIKNCRVPPHMTKKDLKQDIMVAVLKNKHKFDDKRASIITWAYTIIDSTIKNFYKSQTSEERIPYFVQKRITQTVSKDEVDKNDLISEENIMDNHYDFDPFNYTYENELMYRLYTNTTVFQRKILNAKLNPPKKLFEMAKAKQEGNFKRKKRMHNNSRYCEVIRITNEMIAEYYNASLQEVRTALKHINKMFNKIINS